MVTACAPAVERELHVAAPAALATVRLILRMLVMEAPVRQRRLCGGGLGHHAVRDGVSFFRPHRLQTRQSTPQAIRIPIRLCACLDRPVGYEEFNREPGGSSPAPLLPVPQHAA